MPTSQPLVINLPNIPSTWYMTWSLSTQAANLICATLSDSGGKTYNTNTCRQDTAFGILDQGFAQVANPGLQLSITATNSVTALAAPVLVSATNAFALTDPLGANVAFGYNIAIEDSTDNDFNDLYVTIVAWASQT